MEAASGSLGSKNIPPFPIFLYKIILIDDKKKKSDENQYIGGMIDG